MNVINCIINFMLGYANNPTLEVTVNKNSLPESKDMVYTNEGSLYFAHKDGYVRFFAYEKPGDGFGGAKYVLYMEDGSTKVLYGPWSSRAGVMNAHGFEPCVDVNLNENHRYAAAITLELAQQAIAQVNDWYGGEFKLVMVDDGGDIRFDIAYLADGEHLPAEIGNDIPENVQIMHTFLSGQMTMTQIAKRTCKTVEEVRRIIEGPAS